MIHLLLSVGALSSALIAQRGFEGGEDPWAALSKYDKDKNGEITAEEYPRGERGFANLDRDGDGVITKSDLESMGRRGGGRAGGRGGRAGRSGRGGERRDIGTMIAGMLAAQADGDQDGAVTLAEWTAHINSLDTDDDAVLSADEMAGQLRMGGGGRSQRGGSQRGGAQRGGAQRGGAAGGASRMLRRLDKDGDGALQVSEVASLFAGIDANQDDVLSSEELPRRRGGGRSAGAAPAVGDQAPDFDLPLVKDAEQSIKLSSFRGKKPVALIFGSYT